MYQREIEDREQELSERLQYLAGFKWNIIAETRLDQVIKLREELGYLKRQANVLIYALEALPEEVSPKN